jgi:hypothetical protein
VGRGLRILRGEAVTRRHANLQGPGFEPPEGWLRPVKSLHALPLRFLRRGVRGALRSTKQYERFLRMAARFLRAMNGKGVPTARQRRLNRQRRMQATRKFMRRGVDFGFFTLSGLQLAILVRVMT